MWAHGAEGGRGTELEPSKESQSLGRDTAQGLLDEEVEVDRGDRWAALREERKSVCMCVFASFSMMVRQYCSAQPLRWLSLFSVRQVVLTPHRNVSQGLNRCKPKGGVQWERWKLQQAMSTNRESVHLGKTQSWPLYFHFRMDFSYHVNYTILSLRTCVGFFHYFLCCPFLSQIQLVWT